MGTALEYPEAPLPGAMSTSATTGGIADGQD